MIPVIQSYRHKRPRVSPLSPSMVLRLKGDRRRGESENRAPPCISSRGRMNERSSEEREPGKRRGSPDPDDIPSRLTHQKRNICTLPSSTVQPLFIYPYRHLSVLDLERGRAELRSA